MFSNYMKEDHFLLNQTNLHVPAKSKLKKENYRSFPPAINQRERERERGIDDSSYVTAKATGDGRNCDSESLTTPGQMEVDSVSFLIYIINWNL